MDTGQFLNRNALKLALVVLVVAAVLAMAAGAGYAYSDSPQFCGSFCHSMASSHETWLASNHKQFKCTECHLPQDNLVAKMIAKGQTGMSDTYHEVVRDYPENIRITEKGKAIVQDNCLRCHKSTVENTFMANGQDDCTRCHRGLVHSIDQSKGGIKIE